MVTRPIFSPLKLMVKKNKDLSSENDVDYKNNKKKFLKIEFFKQKIIKFTCAGTSGRGAGILAGGADGTVVQDFFLGLSPLFMMEKMR